jgi:FemAB-related protein (PEP-CTERM system-associated)
VKIETANTPMDGIQWDNYVNTNENSHFEQFYGWKEILEKTYGCETQYLMAKDGEEIVGILPLLIIGRSIFGGNYVSSLPGGICANSNEIACQLIDKAVEITKNRKAKYLKIRDGHKEWKYDGLVTHIEYTFVADNLPSDPEVIWKSLNKYVRKKVSKAKKAELTVEWGKDNLEYFHSVYSTNMRDLGTPATPKGLFQRVIKKFPKNSDLLSARYKENGENKVIGGMFVFYHNGIIYGLIASSLRDYFEYCPNDILYWEVLSHSCEKGLREFDMGRSEKDSGVAKFKEKWTAKPRELFYQYFLNTARKIPDTRGGMKYKIGSKIWRRLPLRITDGLSPMIRKSVPDEI